MKKYYVLVLSVFCAVLGVVHAMKKPFKIIEGYVDTVSEEETTKQMMKPFEIYEDYFHAPTFTVDALQKDFKRIIDDARKTAKTEAEKSYWNYIYGYIPFVPKGNKYDHNYETIGPKTIESNEYLIAGKTDKDTPILLVSIHGTFADMQEAGGLIEFKNTAAIKDYAQHIANAYGRNVDLLVFQWAGENNESNREAGGKALSFLILKWLLGKGVVDSVGSESLHQYKKKTGKDVLLFSVTHSWGGAVMQYAAKYVYINTKKTIDFDLGIQTACPVPHVKNTTFDGVFRFKKLFQFYTTTDLTQVLGSTFTFSEIGGRKMPDIRDKDHELWNVRVQNDGHEITHIDIKWLVMEKAYDFVTLIEKCYPNNFDLDANIIPNDKMQSVARDIAQCQQAKQPKPLLIAVRSGSSSGDTYKFDDCNKKIFKQMYGFSIIEKSSIFTRWAKTAFGSPWYFWWYSKADAKVKEDMEKPQKGTWVIEIKNNSGEDINVNIYLNNQPNVKTLSLDKGKTLYFTNTYNDDVKQINVESKPNSKTKIHKTIYNDEDKKTLSKESISVEKGDIVNVPVISIDVSSQIVGKRYGTIAGDKLQLKLK